MRRSAANPHLQALAEHTEWEWHFNQLAEFIHSHGHADLGTHPVNDWLQRQRHSAHLKKLSPVRQQRLSDLGIDLDQDVTPLIEEPDDEERPRKTPAQNLIALWETRYVELCTFKEQHGHANVTKSQNRTLNHWRDVQREFRRKGKLDPGRIARLDAIGFEWEAAGLNGRKRDEWVHMRWNENFIRLSAFKDRFGHTQVPQRWPEDTSLATWVAEQRKSGAKGRLLAERRQRLDALGFDWKPATRPMRADRGKPRPSVTKQARWEQRYAELSAFKQQHGHTRVPNKRLEVAQLCKWCYSQRAFRRQGVLSADRIACLDALGFDWDNPSSPGKSYQQHLADSWDAQYARLTAFHQRFGHSRIPVSWAEDKPLVQWVEKQRKAAREGRLSPAHRARLDALGFVWKADNSPVFSPRPDQHGPKPAHDVIWLRHFDNLRVFHQQHGHFRPSESQNALLHRWCAAQRKARRAGTLTLARQAQLAVLGFE